jgi:hypothetical protein
VFPNRAEMVPDEVVDQMRAATSFRSTSAATGDDADHRLHRRATPTTAAVVNEYVTRVLDENVRLRTGLAEQTLDFFEQEVARLGEDLSRQSARILEFKNQNIDALPEGMDYRMNRQSLLMERRAQLERDLSAARTCANASPRSSRRPASCPARSRTLTPEQQALIQARRELETARAIYSDTNPRVRVLIARVEQLEREVAGTAGTVTRRPDEALFEMQMSEIDAREAFLDEQIALITNELEQLEDAIARTPANAITLQALERDYENISARYNAATQRLATAAVGERIELTSKGQRITVLRQAVVPREPTSPNRPLIVAAGRAGLGARGRARGASRAPQPDRAPAGGPDARASDHAARDAALHRDEQRDGAPARRGPAVVALFAVGIPAGPLSSACRVHAARPARRQGDEQDRSLSRRQE